MDFSGSRPQDLWRVQVKKALGRSGQHIAKDRRGIQEARRLTMYTRINEEEFGLQGTSKVSIAPYTPVLIQRR